MASIEEVGAHVQYAIDQLDTAHLAETLTHVVAAQTVIRAALDDQEAVRSLDWAVSYGSGAQLEMGRSVRELRYYMLDIGVEADNTPAPLEPATVRWVSRRATEPAPGREASQEEKRKIVEHLRYIREVARGTVSHEAGLRTADIRAYFTEQGLRMADTLVLLPDEVPAFVDKMARVGCCTDPAFDALLEDRSKRETCAAAYSVNLDLIVAVRWPGVSVEELEYLLVHEGAHSSSQHAELTLTRDSPTGPTTFHFKQIGHTSLQEGSGALIEEGYAELQAANYFRNRRRMPNGAWPDARHRRVGDLPPLPPVYIWPRPNNGAAVVRGAFMAYGLELLARHSPDLLPALVDARRSAEGLCRVERALNAVRPGLHDALTASTDTVHNAVAGLRKIQDALDDL